MLTTPSGLDSPEGRKIMERIGATFTVEFEPLDVDGSPLEVLSITNMQAHIDGLLKAKKIHDPLRDLPLWAKIWPSSFILGRFLRRYAAEGKRLLEIGAGMGICGMIAARYGFSHVTVTDSCSDALDFARANILRNNLEETVSVRHLDLRRQGDPLPEKQDIIAASEILYLDDLHSPLLKFADRNLAEDGKAFFCTDMARLKPHFKKLAAKNFAIQEGHIGVKTQDDDGCEQRRVYSVLILERK